MTATLALPRRLPTPTRAKMLSSEEDFFVRMDYEHAFLGTNHDVFLQQ